MLLSSGIEINHINSNGVNATCMAYFYNDIELFEFFINNGGDINIERIVKVFRTNETWYEMISLILLNPENLFNKKFHKVYMKFCKFSTYW